MPSGKGSRKRGRSPSGSSSNNSSGSYSNSSSGSRSRKRRRTRSPSSSSSQRDLAAFLNADRLSAAAHRKAVYLAAPAYRPVVAAAAARHNPEADVNLPPILNIPLGNYSGFPRGIKKIRVPYHPTAKTSPGFRPEKKTRKNGGGCSSSKAAAAAEPPSSLQPALSYANVIASLDRQINSIRDEIKQISMEHSHLSRDEQKRLPGIKRRMGMLLSLIRMKLEVDEAEESRLRRSR